MKWFPWLMVLVLFSLAGCGDDHDYYWNGSEFADKEAVVVGSFALSPASLTDVVPGSLQESDPEPINIYGPYADISVVNGEYSVNFGSFVSGPGIVRNSDSVRVRHKAADGPNQTVTTTLTIGDKSASFSSTTGSTPAELQIEAAGVPLYLNVAPSATQLFGPVTITMSPGFDVPISVTGGEYSINGGSFTSTSGSVRNKDEIRFRHLAANGMADTTRITIASIGHYRLPFTSSTTSIATQEISVTAAPISTVSAEAIVLSSGTQAVSIEEAPFLARFSFDNEIFYDVPAEIRTLQAGQPLYLSDYSPANSGQSFTSVVRIGDTQRVLFKVTAL